MTAPVPPVSWFVELYPDEKERGRVGLAIGGQEGLAKLYNCLIVKTKDALKGAIDAALPAQGPQTQVLTLTHPDGRLETIDVVEAVQRLTLQSHVYDELALLQFEFSEGKATKHRDPQFSQRVKQAYRAIAGKGLCWCLLTNCKLPGSNVIAAHLFKFCWSEQSHLLQIEDIDDSRNGLPLWKPLKWAYDNSRICFTYNDATEEFCCKLLDQSLADVRLADKGQALMGLAWKSPPAAVRHLTYGMMNGEKLEFDPQSTHRPFRRALNFQARCARRKAIREGWVSSAWNFPNYHTEGLASTAKVRAWFKTI